MAKITVGYIITTLELGGAQKVCLELFKGLKHNDHHTFLITSNEGTLAPLYQDVPTIFFLQNLQRAFCYKQLTRELGAFVQLIKILRTLRKNHSNFIVHTHSTKAGLLGRWAAFFAGVKTRIHTVHGFSFHAHQLFFVRWLHMFLEIITSFITTSYVCVSSKDIAIARKMLPFFNRKTTSIIRAAVKTGLFEKQETSIKAKNFIIGTIACFKPQKNIFDLLKAFERSFKLNSTIRLEILGDGAQRESIEAWIAQRKLQDFITLHGWCHDIVPIMQRWQVFALTSLWEGLPCAVVEARMLKLPVVAYDTGGISDVISHNLNGLLIKQGNWLGISDSLVQLSWDATLYASLANYQDDLVEYDVQTMLKHHMTLYERYYKATP